jgi:disulfide bond formation protein DsbB
MNGFEKARALAFGVPFALMTGALGSQFIGGLFPCEMCHWQRWPHYVAIGLAALAFVVPASLRRSLVWLAALAILTSGAIGVSHAGVEYKWWPGITPCAKPPGGSGNVMADIMAAPLVSCDQAQWSLFGISLAGFNALISISATLFIARLLGKKA